jgi:PAS domain S-box-containing protein
MAKRKPDPKSPQKAKPAGKRTSHGKSKVNSKIKSFEIGNERFEKAISAARMGLWEWNLKTDVLLWSDEVYAIFGHPKDKAQLGIETFAASVHPDDQELVRTIYDNAIKNSTNYLLEHRIVWPISNEVRWVQATGCILKDKKGNPFIMTGTVQDITHRKTIEEQKNEVELMYATLFHNVADAIFVFAMDDHEFGKVISANQTAAEMHGYTLEEFLQLSLRDIDTSEDYELAQQLISRMANGERLLFEINHRKKDGSVFPVEAAAGVFEVRGKKYLMAIERDISARKRTEETLRESEVRFRTLQEASFGGIAIHDKGIIIEANRGLAEVAGYAYEELIGMNGLELITPEQRDFVLNKIASGYEQPYDSMGIRKDGTRYHVEVHGKNIPYKGRQVRVTEFRNINDRKQAEEKIREQNDRLLAIAQSLRRKNEQLEEFTQIVSHNLRSPVGNINSLVELMQASDKPEDATQIISLLKESGKSLLTTLNELNEVLQIKQNKNIEKQNLVVEEVFVKIRKMLISQINEVNAEVTHDFTSAPDIIYPNIYLESIFLNLLSNALKYISPERRPKIHFRTYISEKKNIILEVQDNGLGINLEKHGHQIFKLRKTFHKHPESRGIGLFMIKNQIEIMGGEINVKSEESKGTTFIVNFTKNAVL